MSFPITKTHPTEIVFTMVTLHMVTASIFFYANIAFWALQNMIKLTFTARSAVRRSVVRGCAARWGPPAPPSSLRGRDVSRESV